MELQAAIQERRAAREYEPGEVSKADLIKVIDAAVWAPSAMNGQSWHFTVVTDKALMRYISDAAKAWMLQNPSVVSEQLAAMLHDPGFHIFHHAPALIVISAPESDKWATENCALAAENLMLAATDLALGTCWIGLAQGWLNTPEGRRALSLPSSLRVVAPIIVGYPVRLRAACQIHRKRPDIAWIGHETSSMAEDGQPRSQVSPGIYGTLLHP